jgi:hypothetical protein
MTKGKHAVAIGEHTVPGKKLVQSFGQKACKKEETSWKT